jgi:hypothetical protein
MPNSSMVTVFFGVGWLGALMVVSQHFASKTRPRNSCLVMRVIAATVSDVCQFAVNISASSIQGATFVLFHNLTMDMA